MSWKDEIDSCENLNQTAIKTILSFGVETGSFDKHQKKKTHLHL